MKLFDFFKKAVSDRWHCSPQLPHLMSNKVYAARSLRREISYKVKKKDNRTAKRKIGDKGEQLATEYLKKQGYRILERNWRHGRNEIDVIAAKNEYVVFVEVKTTSSNEAQDYKYPSQFVDSEKRKNITNCARQYALLRKRSVNPMGYSDVYRFDVIEVFLNRETPEINHIQDAFFAEKGYKNQWKT